MSTEVDAPTPHALMLEVLAGHNEPIGAATIYQGIVDTFPTSEATIGRWLREFDRMGLTKKHGRRGRTITDEGRLRLVGLQQHREHMAGASDLLKAIHIGTVDRLLEVLEARVLLESEIVKAAALAISDEQLVEAEAIIQNQKQAINSGQTAQRHDVEFHDLIGRASGKTILAQTVRFIRTTSQVSPYLSAIRTKVHPVRSVEAHKAILRALKRRSPQGAVRAMRSHIESLIRDVRVYRDTHGSELS